VSREPWEYESKRQKTKGDRAKIHCIWGEQAVNVNSCLLIACSKTLLHCERSTAVSKPRGLSIARVLIALAVIGCTGRVDAQSDGQPDKRSLPAAEKLSQAVGDQDLMRAHGRLADAGNHGPNPYLKGFPPPKPFNERYKTAMVRNATGLLIKAESEYARAEAGIATFLTNNYIPAIRRTMRLAEAEIAEIRSAARPADARLNAHENIVYNVLGERALLLDLYTPRTTPARLLPVVIFVHGGGWLDGSHRTNRPVAMSLAEKGFAGIAVEYRLGRETLFPAAVWDVKAAVRWVRKNAERYHLDSSFITIAGGSAGGNIAGLVGVTNGDARFEGDGQHREFSSDVHGIISLDGAIGECSANWTGGPGKDPWLHNEAIPLFHMIQLNRCPPLLFVKGGRPLSAWIEANIADSHSQHVEFRWPHAFECFEPSLTELVPLLTNYLNGQRDSLARTLQK